MSPLRPSQWALLDALYRAPSAVSGDFHVVSTLGGTPIQHPGLAEPLKASDLGELNSQGFTRLTNRSRTSSQFRTTNAGWDNWEVRHETGVERIEAETRRLLDPVPAAGPYA